MFLDYKKIRFLFIATPVVFLFFLVYKDFNPSGYLKVDYDFCREDPFISRLSPSGRVLEIEERGRECTQRMVLEPVYFDVRLPQRFERARLKLIYQQKQGKLNFKIGPAASLADWRWQLQEFVFKGEQDGWLEAVGEYDLRQSEMKGNILRFLVSAPDLEKVSGEIIFKRIEIEFYKQPLKSDNWQSFLKEWFLSFVNFSR